MVRLALGHSHRPPETVIAWHRRGFRLFWTWKSRHRTGRPAIGVVKLFAPSVAGVE
jgi:hypothetical protein